MPERKPIPIALTRPTSKDLYWAAGFIDGEGCFSLAGGGICARMSASQTKDPWPLERLVALFGGRVSKFKAPKSTKWSQAWEWSVTGPRALGVMQTLLPLMSPRRQQRIAEVVAVAKTHPGRWKRVA